MAIKFPRRARGRIITITVSTYRFPRKTWLFPFYSLVSRSGRMSTSRASFHVSLKRETYLKVSRYFYKIQPQFIHCQRATSTMCLPSGAWALPDRFSIGSSRPLSGEEAWRTRSGRLSGSDHSQHLSSHHQSIPHGVNKRGGAAAACCSRAWPEPLTGQEGHQREGRQQGGHNGEARAYHTRARCASTAARSCGLRTTCSRPERRPARDCLRRPPSPARPAHLRRTHPPDRPSPHPRPSLFPK